MKSSKVNGFFKVFFALLFIIGLCAASVIFLNSRYIELNYSALPFNEIPDDLNNPYQGLYYIRGYRLSQSDDALSNLEPTIERDTYNRLVLIEINLSNYADSDLDSVALNQLDTVLTKWSEAGKQIILRFLYDWSGNNLETEPKTVEQVAAHMEQVAPTVNRHADHIYILQGIFLGDYGEMHHSAHLSKENTRMLMEKLAEVTDPSIFLGVRTPGQWKTVTGLEDFPDGFPAFDGSLLSRLSLFNDGMLGSVSDLGTYTSDNGAEAAREEGIGFQEKLCNYVPNGGEIVIDNPYNDFENAVNDLRRMHVSYINSDYDRHVYNKWSETEYKGDDCFNGVDGYTYIRQHLGYRYVIRSDRIESNSRFDGRAHFYCTLENVGFGSCMHRLSISLEVKNVRTGSVSEIEIPDDIRRLKSGKTMQLSADIPLSGYEKGSYRVYLKITDPVSGGQIKLANDLELTDDGYLLGKFITEGLLK